MNGDHRFHTESFKSLKENGGLQLTGIKGESFCPIAARSSDQLDELPSADVILVIYVANHHAEVAKHIAPHVRDGQIVAFNPGYLGSMILSREMERCGNRAQALFCEFETLTFSSRLLDGGHVHICSENVCHPFATFPSAPTEAQRSRLRDAVGECVLRENLLEVALHNPNLVIHTIGVLLSPTAVEAPSQTFALNQDGFSPSVWKVVDALDEEKMTALERIGCPRRTYFEEFQLRTFGKTGMDQSTSFAHYANEAPDGPFTVDHRYVTEDVPKGLGLLQALGRLHGFETPISDGLIALANTMLPHRRILEQVEAVGEDLKAFLSTTSDG